MVYRINKIPYEVVKGWTISNIFTVGITKTLTIEVVVATINSFSDLTK